MKVALLSASLEALGGMEMVVVRTARYLRETGREVVVATAALHPDLEGACRADGVEVRLLERDLARGRRADLERAAGVVAESLGDCDAINVHNFPAHAWLWRARARLGERVYLYSCHEPPRAIYEGIMDARYVRSGACPRPWFTRAFDALAWTAWRRLDRAAVASYPVVFTNSTYTARCIQRIYGREAVATWFGAPMPLEKRETSPPPRPATSLRLLSVGRLTAMKNVSAVVEAMIHLGPAAGVTLRVAGEGDCQAALESRVLGAAVDSHVAFLGSLSEDALEAEYLAADAVVYVPYDEPMGLVPMEAALRGVPSIASDHGGPAEIFVDGESALLVPPERPDRIAEAMQRLKDDALRRRLAEAARRRVEGLHFGHYAAHLEQVLQGQSPATGAGKRS